MCSCDTAGSYVHDDEQGIQTDFEPPTVEFLDPSQRVFGDVELVVVASDNEGVTRVVFEAHLDNQSLIIGEDSTANENNSYSVYWSSGEFPRGDWKIYAVAYDAAGNTESAIFQVTLGILLRGGGLSIGDYYQGGIVFYIDDTGRHGLIASFNDLGETTFNKSGLAISGATGDGVGAGRENTRKIIALNGNGGRNYAAKMAGDHVSPYPIFDWSTWQIAWVNADDWYLPSKYELNLLYEQRDHIGDYKSLHFYWSSTETNSHYGWVHNFLRNIQKIQFKDYSSQVRAIRTF